MHKKKDTEFVIKSGGYFKDETETFRFGVTREDVSLLLQMKSVSAH